MNFVCGSSQRLGIDVEMQKLVTEEAVLEDDQPLELDQLRLICLSPEYGLVVVEGTRPSGFEQPCPAKTQPCVIFVSYSWVP